MDWRDFFVLFFSRIWFGRKSRRTGHWCPFLWDRQSQLAINYYKRSPFLVQTSRCAFIISSPGQRSPSISQRDKHTNPGNKVSHLHPPSCIYYGSYCLKSFVEDPSLIQRFMHAHFRSGFFKVWLAGLSRAKSWQRSIGGGNWFGKYAGKRPFNCMPGTWT